MQPHIDPPVAKKAAGLQRRLPGESRSVNKVGRGGTQDPFGRHEPTFELAIDAVPSEVSKVRHQSKTWLKRSCHMPCERVESVALIVSELLTNAVLHGAGGRRVFFRTSVPEPGILRLEIDSSTPTTPPAPQTADDLDESGRGLFLVDVLVGELGGQWGFSPDGAVAWCHIAMHNEVLSGSA
ncbi:ATP-binding protein [Streptomyces sp. LHD-70]|uniref:ATP-binding protein n=1 Tax=Streptomyces sp. LHD-70 TaxID=3072140 RepID=UPI00280E7E99|nr:ATP-binding protein [Streptomyces sp. LHD-70]MDQ8708231.1 ATP-binding protein [Streptomyces sp. LHD-70]